MHTSHPHISPVLNFVRHYGEMVVAMLFGMLVAGAGLRLAGFDVSSWHDEAPVLMLLGMAFTMTVPMVAWMRHRGHGLRAAWEMTASMFIPTFAAIALFSAGVVEDSGTLMTIQHTVMFTAMFAVMLLRPSEYTQH